MSPHVTTCAAAGGQAAARGMCFLRLQTCCACGCWRSCLWVLPRPLASIQTGNTSRPPAVLFPQATPPAAAHLLADAGQHQDPRRLLAAAVGRRRAVLCAAAGRAAAGRAAAAAGSLLQQVRCGAAQQQRLNGAAQRAGNPQRVGRQVELRQLGPQLAGLQSGVGSTGFKAIELQSCWQAAAMCVGSSAATHPPSVTCPVCPPASRPFAAHPPIPAAHLLPPLFREPRIKDEGVRPAGAA